MSCLGWLPPLGRKRYRRLLYACGLNRSMQHLHSSIREGDVENEATTEDLLQLRTKKPDVGSLGNTMKRFILALVLCVFPNVAIAASLFASNLNDIYKLDPITGQSTLLSSLPGL
jgi:hypothetical protein